MFLEMAELLLCPHCRDEKSFCVVVPTEMVDRSVRHGTVGCPLCKREYPIMDGVAVFGDIPLDSATAGPSRHDPNAVEALLGLTGPGGYVALIGSAAQLASEVAVRLEGVHIVVVDPPTGFGDSPGVSVIRGGPSIALKSRTMRGAVVGRTHVAPPWLDEAVRLVLPGLRLVILDERASPAGVERLALGEGMWVGRRAHS